MYVKKIFFTFDKKALSHGS